MAYELNTDFDFEDNNLDTPNKILQDICEEMNTKLYGLAFFNINEYEGEIESYNKMAALTTAIVNLGESVRIDIQKELGQIGDEISFRYEMILSSQYIEEYKYRILFLGFGASGYPVKVVLEQGIADELNKEENSDYIFAANDREQFEGLIVEILNSKKLRSTVQDLIKASNLRRKQDQQTQDKN